VKASKLCYRLGQWLKIDFRLVPDQEPHDIIKKLRAHLHSQGYGDITITVLGASEPVVTPIKDPLAQRITAIAQRYAQKAPSIIPIFGGTLPLLGALRRYVGLPGLSAPGNPSYWGSSAHSPNEHIRIGDLERAVRFQCFLFQALGEKMQ